MALRRLFILTVALICGVGCSSLSESVYTEALLRLEVEVVYPEGFDQYRREGVQVVAEEITSLNRYSSLTDQSGRVSFELIRGFYRIMVADNAGEAIFNGMTDKVQLTDADGSVTVPLSYSKPGTIIIKEIYSGGCSKAPEQGTYQSDRYFILHNNSSQVQYLDGLCVGTLEPYNASSTSGNVWTDVDPQTGATIFREYAPIVECVWRFPGSGEEFPLQAGEDVVVVVNGAIDHTQQYPLSVNLNSEEYFVCYNPTLYPNVSYHPVPGDKISSDRYMECAIKVGKANGYILSLNSPTLVIFRSPEDVDIDAYFDNLTESTVTKPGSSEICVKIPWEWIIDGVEVYNGESTKNEKRMHDSVDAGFVYLSTTFQGHTLHRKLDEKSSEAAGIEIYCDTNNSSHDFYERDQQSLKEL